ncbi:MAG: hypothetical protein AAF705_20845, partial [Bacteroidota bacterium]
KSPKKMFTKLKRANLICSLALLIAMTSCQTNDDPFVEQEVPFQVLEEGFLPNCDEGVEEKVIITNLVDWLEFRDRLREQTGKEFDFEVDFEFNYLVLIVSPCAPVGDLIVISSVLEKEAEVLVKIVWESRGGIRINRSHYHLSRINKTEKPIRFVDGP